MPDPTLYGNNLRCPACDGKGRVRNGRVTLAPIDGGARAVPVLDTNTCLACHGTGRVPRPVEDIIADMRRGA